MLITCRLKNGSSPWPRFSRSWADLFDSVADGTRGVYQKHLAYFGRWCQGRGIRQSLVETDHIKVYVKEMREGRGRFRPARIPRRSRSGRRLLSVAVRHRPSLRRLPGRWRPRPVRRLLTPCSPAAGSRKAGSLPDAGQGIGGECVGLLGRWSLVSPALHSFGHDRMAGGVIAHRYALGGMGVGDRGSGLRYGGDGLPVRGQVAEVEGDCLGLGGH